MKPLFAALIVVSMTVFSPAAQSTAMYSSTASSSFAVSGAGVMLGPVITSETEIGTGVATFGGAQSGVGVLPATLSVAISGSASQPPNSLATSTYMSGHIIRIDNTHGSGTLIVPFTFSYEWDTDISVTDALHEFAEAGAFFGISGIDNEFLVIGGVSVAEFLLNPHYSTGLGEIGGIGSGSVSGTIEIPGGVFSEISVITDTTGRAIAQVPEPSTLWLLSFGLAFGLLRLRGVSRQAASDIFSIRASASRMRVAEVV